MVRGGKEKGEKGERDEIGTREVRGGKKRGEEGVRDKIGMRER